MHSGGADNSAHQGASGSVVHAREQPQELLQQVVAALQGGQTQHAADLLISAHAAGTLPERTAMLPELARRVSPNLVAELLLQMATFPCFYCRVGLQSCEACEGRGRLGDDLPCERCVGLGVARCDFCDGTGWTSLEALPPSLRPLIILQRVRLALRASRKLLAQAPAPLEHAGEREARRAAARQVLAVERQRALLADALATAERAGANSRLGKELEKLLPACAACVPRVESRLRECLSNLADVSRREAEREDADPHSRRRARSRVSYYDQLRRSGNFAGTGLERLQLSQVARRILRQARDAAQKDNGNTSSGGPTAENPVPQ